MERVNQAEARALLARQIHLRVLGDGFERISETRWVRTTKEPIREVIAILTNPFTIYVTGGLALSYVPVVTNSRASRPLKPELGRSPLHLDWKTPRTLPPAIELVQLKTSHVQAAVKRSVPLWLKHIKANFETVQSLRDLCDQLRPYSIRTRDTGPNGEIWPDHQLALAYTLALLGDRAAATSELDGCIKRYGWMRYHSLKLREWLRTPDPTTTPSKRGRKASTK